MKRQNIGLGFHMALLLMGALVLAPLPARAQSGSPQNPSGPQKFEIATGESASFGFVVNKPGLIIVVCEWHGGPLTLTVSGPLAQPITQTGSGQIHLQYSVTPQDISRGQLWRILIHQPSFSANAQATATGGKPVLIDTSNAASLVHRPQIAARGTVNLQHPPGDVNQALAQHNASTQKNSSPSNLQAAQQQMLALLQARKALLAKQLADRQAAQAAQVKLQFQTLNQTPPKSPPPPPGPSGGNPVTGQIVGVVARPQKLPSTRGPGISSLTVSQGQPNDSVGITGAGFGDAPGEVHFVVNPGKDLIAPVDTDEEDGRGPGHPIWSNTGISVRVPRIDGVLAYNGYVYVVSGGKASNRVPFQFNPTIDHGIPLPITSANVTWGFGGCQTAPGGTSELDAWIRLFKGAVPQAGCWVDSKGNALAGVSGGYFSGAKGDDVFFNGYQLKNGWVMDGVIFAQGQTISGNCSVAASGIGTTSPNVDIHWWVDGGGVTSYELSITVSGPKGVPYQ